jgi:glycine/D-amino acid oxidase-like deaminating enzyme
MRLARSDVLVIGGGIAGIATALDLLDGNKSVLLLDRDEDGAFGGLARESFGGMFFVDSPEQRRQVSGIPANSPGATGAALPSSDRMMSGRKPGPAPMSSAARAMSITGCAASA